MVEAVDKRNRNGTMAITAERPDGWAPGSAAISWRSTGRPAKAATFTMRTRQRFGETSAVLRQRSIFLRHMHECEVALDNKKVSLIGSGVKLIASSERGNGIAGYDLQIAVDP